MANERFFQELRSAFQLAPKVMAEAFTDHVFQASIDAVHPRAYGEYLNIGGEYAFLRTVFLRVGYITNHAEYGLTAGLGLQQVGIAVDYSFMPHEIFNTIHRISVKFAM